MSEVERLHSLPDKSSLKKGTCGNHCEACARRDDEIERLQKENAKLALDLMACLNQATGQYEVTPE